MTQSPELLRADRLSAFFDAFPLEVQARTPRNASEEGSTLYLVPDSDGGLGEVLLVVRGGAAPERFAMAAAVNFGGASSVHWWIASLPCEASANARRASRTGPVIV